MGGISAEIALAAANTFTVQTVEGAGAIKGKNCTISSITEITGGHRVTFKWYLDNGTEQTAYMDVMDGQSGGGGTSDYSDLSNKPSINSVTLSGNKTTSDLGISYNDLSNKPTIPSISNCYQTTDTAGSSLDNDDTVPFYDTSATTKNKITWSNIKATLKTYFDTLYSTVSTIAGLSDVTVSSPTNGQVLKYDSTTSKWVNANESGGGSSTMTTVVSCAIGATSAQFTNPLNSTSIVVNPYCSNSSGTPKAITSFTVTTSTITLNFAELTEATDFVCEIRSIS